MSNSLPPYGLQPTGLCPMGFSKLEYWSGLPFPPPGDLPNSGIEPTCPADSCIAGRFFTVEPPGKPKFTLHMWYTYLMNEDMNKWQWLRSHSHREDKWICAIGKFIKTERIRKIRAKDRANVECLHWRHRGRVNQGFKAKEVGTFLVVQWLRLHTLNAGELSLIPCQGNRSHVLQLTPYIFKKE